MTEGLEKILLSDENVIIMDADLASANGTSSLHSKYPGRVINVGISEANMTSMAAGMATYGMKPFILTFTAFASRRVADQLAISAERLPRIPALKLTTDHRITICSGGGSTRRIRNGSEGRVSIATSRGCRYGTLCGADCTAL